MCARKECAFCRVLLRCPIDVAYNKLFDSIILVISVHADFFVVFLSVFVNRLLKSLSIIIKFSVSSFNSARFYFMYFGALLFSIYVLGVPWWLRWVKNPPAMQETWIRYLGWEDLGHGNPLRYSCLENPHGQRSLMGYTSMESQRVGHNWVTNAHTYAFIILIILITDNIFTVIKCPPF